MKNPTLDDLRPGDMIVRFDPNNEDLGSFGALIISTIDTPNRVVERHIDIKMIILWNSMDQTQLGFHHWTHQWPNELLRPYQLVRGVG